MEKVVSYSVKARFDDPKLSNFEFNNPILNSDSQSQYFNFKSFTSNYS